MSIIYIKIKGGLGNQLFQYAYGRSLELSGKKVIFDISFFNGHKNDIDTARNFKLNYFNISQTTQFSNIYKKEHILYKIYKKIFHVESFFQNEKYFKHIQDSIRHEYTLKNPLTQEAELWKRDILEKEHSVSLHVRRGDYVQDRQTSLYHGTCDIAYYTRAVSLLSNTFQKLHIYVFSDDIEWARNNIDYPEHTISYVSSVKIPDYEELYLMSLCTHNIIANSTFSWWGAWLGTQTNKMIIAPTQWTSTKTATELDILPTSWIQV